MDRKQLRAGGQELRRKLGLQRQGGREALPGIDDLMAEVAYGSIWQRPGLSQADRMICTIAVLGPLERHIELERHIASALDMGLKPEAILEVLLQAGLYGGFITAESGSQIARKVFSDHGIELAPAAPRNATTEELDKRGATLMGELHGDRGKQGYAAPGNTTTAELYPAAIRYGYGELWFRPGLERRQRLLVAVAAFTGLGLETQLAKFAQSALNAGLQRQEIIEAVIQTGPYSGFPRALNGLAILSEVL